MVSDINFWLNRKYEKLHDKIGILAPVVIFSLLLFVLPDWLFFVCIMVIVIGRSTYNKHYTKL